MSDVGLDSLLVESGHPCALCTHKLSEEDAGIFEDLPDLEQLIPEDKKKCLLCTLQDI